MSDHDFILVDEEDKETKAERTEQEIIAGEDSQESGKDFRKCLRG